MNKQANEPVKFPPSEDQQFNMQRPEVSILVDVLKERTGVVINIVPDAEATIIIGAVAALLIAILSYLGRTRTYFDQVDRLDAPAEDGH